MSTNQPTGAMRRTKEGAEAQQNAKGVAFATPGEFGESSATGMIPLNSMYDGEEERQAAIPPTLNSLTPDAVPEEAAKEDEPDNVGEQTTVV